MVPTTQYNYVCDQTCSADCQNCPHAMTVVTETAVVHPPYKDISDLFFWNLKRQDQERFYKLAISTFFNIYAASFIRRAGFSKSGFVGKVGKKRKGKG